MAEARANSLQQLNQRRQRAVEFRLAGKTLPQVRAETGLSAPTIIGACKAFLSAGWGGVWPPPCAGAAQASASRFLTRLACS